MLVLCLPECRSLDWIDLSLCLQCGFLLQRCRLSECRRRAGDARLTGWHSRTRSHCSGSNHKTVISLPNPFLSVASPASLSERKAIIWQAFLGVSFGSFIWKNIQGERGKFFFFLFIKALWGKKISISVGTWKLHLSQKLGWRKCLYKKKKKIFFKRQSTLFQQSW